MKFDIRFLDSIKHPIDGFIDALGEDLECKQFHISVSFLDHRKNSVTLLATGEFGEYMKEKFKNSKDIIFTLPNNYHNPFHNTYEDKDGWLICGCGYRESEQDHIKRTLIITSKPINTLEMTVVSRSEIPK